METNSLEIKHEDRTSLAPKRPDFVVLTKDRPSSMYAQFIIELQIGTINDEHRGKIIAYNTMVLEANTDRVFITSILTNLDVIIIIKSERLNMNVIQHTLSPEVDFWQKGFKYIQHMLNNPTEVGYSEQANFTIEIE